MNFELARRTAATWPQRKTSVSSDLSASISVKVCLLNGDLTRSASGAAGSQSPEDGGFTPSAADSDGEFTT